VLENPLILIHEKRNQLDEGPSPVLEQVARLSRPLLIIAEDSKVKRWRRSSSTSCAARSSRRVKAPGFGDRRKADARRHRDPHQGRAISRKTWDQARIAQDR